MKIPQSLREVIDKGPYAHLTTLNRDGSPQVTVIWVGIEAEEFVIGHLAVHQKVKNIRRDPRVALSFLSDKTNAQGMREYAVDHPIRDGARLPVTWLSKGTISRLCSSF